MAEQYRILFIGAHHEEIEAECPNIAASLALAGCKVHILNPIGGWNWTVIRNLGEGGRERTIANAVAAAKELGCEKTIWDYPVAQCDRYQAEIIDRMAEFVLDFAPDIVMMHWPKDSHADHRLVARITRHAIAARVNISPASHPNVKPVREFYAYQTGVVQAYGFFPDMLVKCTAETMKCADNAVACFEETVPRSVPIWRHNYHAKDDYWGLLAGGPAEALKFLGPYLPLDGFLLKKILGDNLCPAPFEKFNFDHDSQL